MSTGIRNGEPARPERFAANERDGLHLDVALAAAQGKDPASRGRVDEDGVEGPVSVQVAEVEQRDIEGRDETGRAIQHRLGFPPARCPRRRARRGPRAGLGDARALPMLTKGGEPGRISGVPYSATTSAPPCGSMRWDFGMVPLSIRARPYGAEPVGNGPADQRRRPVRPERACTGRVTGRRVSSVSCVHTALVAITSGVPSPSRSPSGRGKEDNS